MPCWREFARTKAAREQPSSGWRMSKVAVIGAGAWGTALALQAARAGHRVVLVARDAATASALAAKRENPRLPGLRLPDAIEPRHDLPGDADLSLWVVPTQHLRS